MDQNSFKKIEINLKINSKKIEFRLAKKNTGVNLVFVTPPSSFGERPQSRLGNEVALAFFAKYCPLKAFLRLFKRVLRGQQHFYQAINILGQILNSTKTKLRKYRFSNNRSSYSLQNDRKEHHESGIFVMRRACS
jgi:hypothetical protein